jgi:8-oxo-dGTP pyrophosphatase MutT (NUDIX family)
VITNQKTPTKIADADCISSFASDGYILNNKLSNNNFLFTNDIKDHIVKESKINERQKGTITLIYNLYMIHANFNVTVKALIKKGNEYLILTQPDGRIDFPGGRFGEAEYEMSFIDLLKRELKEELGTELQYEIDEFIFPCKLKSNFNNKVYVTVAIFYALRYRDGEITLSNEHINMEWQTESEILSNKQLFLEEDLYNALKDYFKK